MAGLPALLNFLEDSIPAELMATALPWGCGTILQCVNFGITGLWPQAGNQWDITEGEFVDDVFISGTANGIIFDGISPGTLRLALFLFGLVKDLIDALPPDNGLLPPDFQFPELPPELAEGKFAFFANATTDGGWEKINSGKYGIEKFNHYVEVNGLTKLPDTWWPNFGPTPSAHKSGVPGICKDIVGTDGTMYPPFINKVLFGSQVLSNPG